MKPILFNSEMSCATRENRKSVTRRLVKMSGVQITGRPKWGDRSEDGGYLFSVVRFTQGWPEATVVSIKPPYQSGDILYVRESFAELPVNPDGSLCNKGSVLYYRADGDLRPKGWRSNNWKPSLHMPKSVARTFIRVTNVYVEQVQDITEEQAKKEGVSQDAHLNDEEICFDARKAFAHLWDKTIKKTELELYGWNANPWVWVIEYERYYPKQ